MGGFSGRIGGKRKRFRRLSERRSRAATAGRRIANPPQVCHQRRWNRHSCVQHRDSSRCPPLSCCPACRDERGTFPAGHVSGVRNQGPLDTFGKM